MNTSFAHLASNVGIDGAARLYEWCRWAKRALKCRAVVGGSAVRRKDFHDVDVTLLWPNDLYDGAVRWASPASSGTSPDAWFLLASALSLQASAMSGLPVEVHLAPVRDWTHPPTTFVEVA